MQYIQRPLTPEEEKWTISAPQFSLPLIKPCKKKQSDYTSDMEKICYKIPYKYNLRISADHALSLVGGKVTMRLLYRNFQVVEKREDDNKNLPLMDCVKIRYSKKRNSLDVGAFFFNVCSYKHDGRHFRLEVTVRSEQQQHLCTMISPAFVIKAKKPIARPGSKKNKMVGQKRKRTTEVPIEPQVIAQPIQTMLPIQPAAVMQNMFVAQQPELKRRKLAQQTPTPFIMPQFNAFSTDLFLAPQQQTPVQNFFPTPTATTEQDLWPLTQAYLKETALHKKPEEQQQEIPQNWFQTDFDANPFADVENFLNGDDKLDAILDDAFAL